MSKLLPEECKLKSIDSMYLFFLVFSGCAFSATENCIMNERINLDSGIQKGRLRNHLFFLRGDLS
jgi:hypothetical protein